MELMISEPWDRFTMSLKHLTQLAAQMAELRNNRDDADVTLDCQGKVFKAHSFVLGFR